MQSSSNLHVVSESLPLQSDATSTIVTKGRPFLVEWQHATHPPSSEKWPQPVPRFEVMVSDSPGRNSFFERAKGKLRHVPLLRGRRAEVIVEVQQSADIRYVHHHPQAQPSKEFTEPIRRFIADSLELEQDAFSLDLRHAAFVPCSFLSTVDPPPIHHHQTVCLHYSTDDIALLSDLPIVRRSRPKFATSGRGLHLHVHTDRDGVRVTEWVAVDSAEANITKADVQKEDMQVTQITLSSSHPQTRKEVFHNGGWEINDVGPPSGPSARVGRWVDKTGLHRILHTGIVLTTRKDSPAACRVCVVEILPTTIYADLNEIRTIGHPRVAAYRDIDVELPSFLSSQHTVLVYSDWTKQSTTTEAAWTFNVSLPIHLRYQHPSDTVLYGNASLGVPAVFYQCRQSDEENFDQSDASSGSFYRPGPSPNADWSAPISVNYLIGRPGKQLPSSQPIVLRVPVGQMADYGLVTAGTLLVTYAICFYLLWVTCSRGRAASPKTENPKQRKSSGNDTNAIRQKNRVGGNESDKRHIEERMNGG